MFKHRFTNDQIQSWKEKISSWQASGQTQAAWCRQHNESRDKLYYWRKHLSLGFNKSIKQTLVTALPPESIIYLFSNPVNLCKGIEGLAQIVAEQKFNELITGACFAFTNKRRNIVKVLYFDGEGMVLWQKRLERGTFPYDTHEKEMSKKRIFIQIKEN